MKVYYHLIGKWKYKKINYWRKEYNYYYNSNKIIILLIKSKDFILKSYIQLFMIILMKIKIKLMKILKFVMKMMKKLEN